MGNQLKRGLMMSRWERRQRKQNKKRYGMVVVGRSVKSLLAGLPAVRDAKRRLSGKTTKNTTNKPTFKQTTKG